MRVVIVLLLLLELLVATQTRQLLVVTTQNWSTSSGKLQRYSYQNSKWQRVGGSISIKLGRNGLGWGRGLHTTPKSAKIIKREGDGKSPAGIFRLKQGFGYAPFAIAYPYRVYKESDHCVDDIKSKYYNQIVDSTRVKADYKSYEKMKFPKDFYRYGIVVDHNPKRVRGAGSCIFIHIKSIPTAGCTVMSQKQIKQILRWLDPHKNPLLIQAPKSEIDRLMGEIINSMI
jgi:D-alanyl-D-alanine dipeptidase